MSDVDVQSTYLNGAMDTIINFVPYAFYCKEEIVDDVLRELRQNMVDLIRQEHAYEQSHMSIRETKFRMEELLANKQFDLDVGALHEEVQQEMEANKQGHFDVSTHPKYLKFERAIAKNKDKDNEDMNGAESAFDDGDVILTSEQVNIIDPITKTVMKNPVKNTLCGHSYEKKTITDLIQQKTAKGRSMRCPMTGCSNSTPLHLNHLVENTRLKKYIAKSQK